MNHKLFLFCMFIVSMLTIQAQNSITLNTEKYWIFGGPSPFIGTGAASPATLEFSQNVNSPTLFSSIALPSNSVQLGWEGTAIVNDVYTGELIFYTDGDKIYNSAHNLVQSGLGGHPSSTQPAAVCAISDNRSTQGARYLIFSNPTGAIGSTFYTGAITYRIYVPTNQILSSPSSLPGPYGTANAGEGMLLIKKANQNTPSYWLITHVDNSNTYVVYSIDGPNVTYHSSAQFGLTNFNFKNIAYCANTKKMAFACYSIGVYTCDFDDNTGLFNTATYQMIDNTEDYFYDVEFSPNGSKLYYVKYLSNPTLHQYDFNSSITNIIYTSPTYRAGGLKLSHIDNKIYHISEIDDSGSGALVVGRIETPELGVSQMGFTYSPNYISYPTNTYGGLYTLNLPEFVVCSESILANDNASFYLSSSIYPNPANTTLEIKSEEITDNLVFINIYDLVGNKVYAENIIANSNISIDIHNFAQGTYLLELKTSKGKSAQHKFVKI